MPHWYLGLFRRSYLLPLVRSISKELVSQPKLPFHIAYVDGEPEEEWKRHFSFHKVNVPYSFIRSKMARFFLSRRKLYRQIEDVDVIFTLSEPWAQEFSRYCSSKMGVPYVVWLRGSHREVRKTRKVNILKERVLTYLETRSLKEADLVIPNCKGLARGAEEWGVEKGKIAPPVYNGVDNSMFRPMTVERSSEFTVAYAGRISPEKGILRLLKIADRLIDVHFLIAGKKQMDVSFPSSIEYLGELPYSEMPKFYNKTDLVVLPSVTEGFPGVILEAYACGKPVLATKEALPEELKVFGSVCDIDEFESEVNRLKKSDLKALGRRARSYVKKYYTWEKFGQSMIELLESVVD